MPVEHRQRRQELLVDTVSGIGGFLRANGEELDAVVVSGDITTHGKRVGMELLPNLLAKLGDKLPLPHRIFVVPGNHDVAYRAASSTPERYKNFVEVVRGLGYVTPFLEGVDSSQEHRPA